MALDTAYVIAYYINVFYLRRENTMATLTASEARSRLYRLIDEAAASHQPIIITGKRANAVLISEDDWRAVQETLYLLSIPGMRESIREGVATPVEECSKDLDW
jgi:antitoxin YefM